MSETPVVKIDSTLREHNFRIVSRPKGGPAIWQRGMRFYTQDEAELVVKFEQEKADQHEADAVAKARKK